MKSPTRIVRGTLIVRLLMCLASLCCVTTHAFGQPQRWCTAPGPFVTQSFWGHGAMASGLASKVFAKLDKSILERAITQGVVLSDAPEEFDPNSRYLFYLHGYIVHAGNTEPVHPEFGKYQYLLIRETFKNSGFVVIGETRKQDREIEPYARKLTGEIRKMLKAGVPAEHITVVGASQGAWIAMLTSTYLENRGVNFVLIAACSADKGFLNMVNLHGNVLSLYERTDLAQSCRDYRTDATGINDWKEVEVNTGLKHGFLYRPLKEWTEPTIAWAKGRH